MKKIFTLFAAALVTLTSFADYRDARLTITQLGKMELMIEVDGRRYNDRDREILINNLEPGRHNIQIYVFERNNGWGGLFGRDNKRKYLYNSILMVRPRQHIDIVVNRFGKVWIDDRDMTDDYGRDYGYNDRDDRRYDGRRNDDREYRYDNTRGPMDNRSFDMLLQALRRENFEKTRLDIAKQSVDRNAFTSEQVKFMVKCFAFDSNKLELAKYAYDHTVDKNNYFIIYEALDFSSSRRELGDWVRGK